MIKKGLQINDIIKIALAEDVVDNDITTKLLISPRQVSRACIIFKEPSVICGLDIAHKVFRSLDRNIKFKSSFKDGDFSSTMSTVAEVIGKTHAIVSGERVALNFLSYLSGIATKTYHAIEATKPYATLVLDTRKTTPGLRILERYAVCCGGGTNHRNNLEEMVFIKDNHWKAIKATDQSLFDLIPPIRKTTHKKIEIEVENIEQFKQVLKIRPDVILLDNMPLKTIRAAVLLRKRSDSPKSPILEASGGITLKNILQIAQTGVDRISMGELTHTTKAINVSLELI